MRRLALQTKAVSRLRTRIFVLIAICALLFCLNPARTFAQPTNDNFASRATLAGTDVLFGGFLSGSTREVDEPIHAGVTSYGSVWWTWTAPSNGVVEIRDSTGPAYAIAQVAAVYQGDSLGALTEVASDSGLFYQTLHFRATAGQSYQIALSDSQDPPRDAACELVLYDSPSNDNFADRLPLEPGQTNEACNIFCSVEAGEPGDASAQHTLWWTWTAPTRGIVKNLNEEHTLVQFFVGNSLETLVRKAPANSFGVVGYEVQAGEVLQIRVDEAPFAAEPQSGHVKFAIQFSGVPANDQFAERMVLSGLPVEVLGDNTLATAEIGEPMLMRQPPLHTMWYEWTAAKSGTIGVLLDANWDTRLVSVYTGNTLGKLFAVAGATYSPVPIAFSARAGRTYIIAVGTTYSSGPFRLAIVGAPTNDNFSAHLILQGMRSESESYTTCASFEGGERRLTPNDSHQSVWWTWQAPMSGFVVLTAKAEYLVALGVNVGDSVSHLTPVPFYDFTFDSFSEISRASFFASSGTVYHISASGYRSVEDRKLLTRSGHVALGLIMATLQVSLKDAPNRLVAPQTITVQAEPLLPEFGYPTNLDFSVYPYAWPPVGVGSVFGPPWEFTFHDLSAGVHDLSASGTNAAGDWQFSAPISIWVHPPNDDFADRAPMHPVPAVLDGSLAGSTTEPAETKLLPTELGSVWYTWTAPSNLPLHVTVYAGALGIYEGDSLDHLRLIRKASTGSFFFNALSNHTYQLKITMPAGSDELGYYVFFARPQPNDKFANRILLSGTNADFNVDCSDATTEPSEPWANPTLWWSWTAPGDGYLFLSETNSHPSTHFALFRGGSLKTLQPIPVDNPGDPSTFRFRVTNSVTYQIAAQVYSTLEASPENVHLRFIALSTNDDFANRIVLTSNSLIMQGANYAATRETAEPARHVGQTLVGATLWWEWTPTESGVATVTTVGGTIHPMVEFFEGTNLNSLVSLTTNVTYYLVPDWFAFTVQAGHKYFISAGSAGPVGEFTLALHPPAPPPNDNFQNAQTVTGTNFSLVGTLYNATREPGEPAVLGQEAYSTVWFAWTAPADGAVDIESNSVLASSTYTGNSVDSLTLIYGQQFDAYLPHFSVQAGVTYYIAVTSFIPGPFSIPFTFVALPLQAG